MASLELVLLVLFDLEIQEMEQFCQYSLNYWTDRQNSLTTLANHNENKAFQREPIRCKQESILEKNVPVKQPNYSVKIILIASFLHNLEKRPTGVVTC